MRLRAVVAWALLVSIAGVCATVLAEAPPAYVIIVHPNNRNTVIERKFLEDAFLKKITRWPDDALIRPVDLPQSSETRRRFSGDVLKRSVEAVRGYWQQRIFSGRDVPPPELDTDDEVVSYVLKNEGAVGYVSGGSARGSAKIVTVR